jgi:hypothetical protein
MIYRFALAARARNDKSESDDSMKFLRSLASLVRGALWLLRAGGLRADVDLLLRRELRRRWLAAGDLRGYEECVSAQNGEDGIIREILQRVGVGRRYFVEFGVESGQECNCARLVRQEHWSGLFLEADAAHFAQLTENYRDYPQIRCARAAVTSNNIEDLLAAHEVPADLDVLSIDIDGNDYWVWRAIQRWRPRLVVIEYNATHPPPELWVMAEDPAHRWDGTGHFGASLASLVALGRAKGYTLVATDSTGVNAFFVADEHVTPGRFLDPVLHYHYSPLNSPKVPDGYPPRSGPFVAQ